MNYDFLDINLININSILNNILYPDKIDCVMRRTLTTFWYDIDLTNIFCESTSQTQIDSKFLKRIKSFKYSLFLANITTKSSKIQLHDFPNKNLIKLNVLNHRTSPKNYDLIYYMFNNIDDFLIFKLKYPNQYWGEDSILKIL